MNHQATYANLQGISHEESLVHPHPGGNCLNWVLGHVVATRSVLLTTLGEAPNWTDAEAAAYQRGVHTPLSPANAGALEDILLAYNASQKAIVSRVSAFTGADLSRPHQGNTWRLGGRPASPVASLDRGDGSRFVLAHAVSPVSVGET